MVHDTLYQFSLTENYASGVKGTQQTSRMLGSIQMNKTNEQRTRCTVWTVRKIIKVLKSFATLNPSFEIRA